MSMLALPESECREILELFRQHLPHVPDAWLEELAANYGQDAIKDIDPNDVIAILSASGAPHRIMVPLTIQETPSEFCNRTRNALTTRGIDPEQIVASLLVIHISAAKLISIGELAWSVAAKFSASVRNGWAWYKPGFPDVGSAIWIVFSQPPSV